MSRRLTLGLDPTIWAKTVVVEEADEEYRPDILLDIDPFIDWGCDYP